VSQARCHSPTSATDIPDSSTQHPIARLPSPQLCSRGDRLLPANPEAFCLERPKSSWGSTASDHLSAIRPRVKQRLTAPPQLQPDASPFPPLNEGEIGPRPEAAATQARRSQPRLKRKIRPLTLLSPPLVTRKTRAPFGDLGRFHRPRVNKSGFPGPKRLSSTCASPTFAGIARHRSQSFAAPVRLPALVRPSDALARKG
jgi:hypothetical protein